MSFAPPPSTLRNAAAITQDRTGACHDSLTVRATALARETRPPDRAPPRAVIGVWIVLTIFGMFSAGQVSKRWFESFSIPGYSAYEANQRDAQDLRDRRAGAARRRVPQRRRHHEGDRASSRRSPPPPKVNPGSRVSSFWSTGSRAYVSKDGHTAFAEIYPPGSPSFSSTTHIKQVRAKLKEATPAGRRGAPDRPRRDLRRVVGRRHRPERAHRGADRRRSARS